MKSCAIRIWYVLLFISIALLIACERSGPVQHHYTTTIGCLIANDFYATYFSAYLEPEDDAEDNTTLFKSYCKNLPRTGIVYFVADLVDEDLREIPIGVQLVEQELIGKDKNLPKSFQDVRLITAVSPQLYPQGTIEAQAKLDTNGYYALHLNIGGDDVFFEDDRLTIPLHVGVAAGAQPIWMTVRMIAEFVMTYLFPVLIFLIILAPLLPTKRWLKSIQNFSGRSLS